MWALPPPPPPGTENPGARAAQEPVGTVLRSPLGGQPGGLALRQVRPPGAHRASPRRGPPPLAPGRPRRPGATFRPWKSAACWGNLDRCCSPRFPVDMQRAQQASRSGEEMSYVRKTKEINTGGVCLQSSCPSLAGGSSEGSSAPAGHWAASPWPAPASSPGLGRPERGPGSAHAVLAASEPFRRPLLRWQCPPPPSLSGEPLLNPQVPAGLPASDLARPQRWLLLFHPSPWKHPRSGHLVALRGCGSRVVIAPVSPHGSLRQVLLLNPVVSTGPSRGPGAEASWRLDGGRQKWKDGKKAAGRRKEKIWISSGYLQIPNAS